MRTFKKLDRRYPLTRFEAYLSSRYASSTVPVYLGAIRRMLAAVDAKWRNWELVLAYFQKLDRGRQNRLMAAWTPWLLFAGASEMPRLGQRPVWLSRQGQADSGAGEVGEAIRVLLGSERGKQFFPREIDFAFAVWRRRDDGGLEVELRDRVLHFGPGLQPCLDIIRGWGWKDGAPPDRGSLFPDRNGNPLVVEDKDRARFYRLRKASCTPEFAEELLRRCQEAVAAAVAKLDSRRT